MGKSDLDRMRRELAAQAEEMEYRSRLVKKASSEETAQVRHVSTEVASMLDAVGRTLDDYESLPPAQRRELESQAQTVLENSRDYLNAAHAKNLYQIQSAPPPKKQGDGFVDDFLDELRRNFLGD